MKKMIDPKEWDNFLQKHPELAEDLDAFFRDGQNNIPSVIGFYSVLKMRIWQFLSFQNKHQATGRSNADDTLPPQASGFET